ncbi:MAG TPA: hypothetical protein PKM75_12100 [Prolixibacteraceae bacterium]|nr:hypothetical protein [Prolixibacteraceae bacterium]
MQIRISAPGKQVPHQSRHKLRAGSDMNSPSFIEDTHISGAENFRFFYQTLGHESVGSKKILHRIGIEGHYFFLGFIGAFYFFDFRLPSPDKFSIDTGSNLIQGKSVAFNGQDE